MGHAYDGNGLDMGMSWWFTVPVLRGMEWNHAGLTELWWVEWGGGGGGDTTVTTVSELYRLYYYSRLQLVQDYKTHVDNKDQDDTVTMSIFGGRVSTENL